MSDKYPPDFIYMFTYRTFNKSQLFTFTFMHSTHGTTNARAIDKSNLKINFSRCRSRRLYKKIQTTKTQAARLSKELSSSIASLLVWTEHRQKG